MERKQFPVYETPEAEILELKPHGMLCGSLDADSNEEFTEDMFEL